MCVIVSPEVRWRCEPWSAFKTFHPSGEVNSVVMTRTASAWSSALWKRVQCFTKRIDQSRTNKGLCVHLLFNLFIANMEYALRIGRATDSIEVRCWLSQIIHLPPLCAFNVNCHMLESVPLDDNLRSTKLV